MKQHCPTVTETDGWDFCSRMRLRAPKLPCGEREECLGCERSGGNATTVSEKLVPDTGTRKCRVCEKLFIPLKGNQKYCSHRCRKRAEKVRAGLTGGA